MAHGGRARGEGRWGGGTKEQCGSNKKCRFTFLGSLQNQTTGLIWLVTRVGGWRAGKGGDGGRGTREQCGNKRCTASPFFDNEGGGMGGVGRWPMEGGQGGRWGGAPGEMGGGAPESVGATKKCTGFPLLGSLKHWSDLAGDEGGGMGGGMGRHCVPNNWSWPRRGEVAHGGGTGSPFLGSLKNLTTGAPESS